MIRDQSIRISIIVPTFNTPKKYLADLIDSLMAQTYTNWQLCVGDGSTDEITSSFIKSYADTDDRIVYAKSPGNLGISGNSNVALKNATGDYIAFLDHDDKLPAWSLNEVATAIKANPHAQIFYTDEDRLTENGKSRMAPLLKPDWSPDLFLSANYMAHFFVIQAGLMKKLRELRTDYDGSQDYDLALRALDHNPKIVHIPKVAYHMRMAKGSTAKSIGEKDYVHDSGKRAIEAYLKRHKIKADVLGMTDMPTNHRIRYHLQKQPMVSVIIPFKDKVELLMACLDKLKATTYDDYEIILVSNNSQEGKTENYLESLKGKKHIKIFKYDKPFNYSAINNFGRKKAKGSVLIFLNNDTEVINEDWMKELVSVAGRKENGAVGPLLLYPDKTIQHAGVILGLTGMAGHVFRDTKLGTLTPFLLPDWPRNYLAVTGACLAIEARKFDEVGGFNEDFIMAGSDVVLCLDLTKKGYKNVYWPFARLVHHESKSVISYQYAPPSDYNNSLIHYRPYLNYNDPYFNPNLSLESEIPILRTAYD